MSRKPLGIFLCSHPMNINSKTDMVKLQRNYGEMFQERYLDEQSYLFKSPIITCGYPGAQLQKPFCFFSQALIKKTTRKDLTKTH